MHLRMSRIDSIKSAWRNVKRWNEELSKVRKTSQGSEKVRDVQAVEGVGWWVMLNVQNVIQSRNEEGRKGM